MHLGVLASEWGTRYARGGLRWAGRQFMCGHPSVGCAISRSLGSLWVVGEGMVLLYCQSVLFTAALGPLLGVAVPQRVGLGPYRKLVLLDHSPPIAFLLAGGDATVPAFIVVASSFLFTIATALALTAFDDALRTLAVAFAAAAGVFVCILALLVRGLAVAAGGVLEDAGRYVGQAPPGTAVFVAYISESSRRVKEVVLRDAIPLDPPEQTCDIPNPFDLKRKRYCAKVKQAFEASRACVGEARTRIVKAITALTPAQGQRTDFEGALLLAGEVLQSFPTLERRMVVMSDGIHNGRKVLPPVISGVEGTKVLIRPPLGMEADGAEASLQRYVLRLQESGAEVRVVSLSVPTDANLFARVPDPGSAADPSQEVAFVNR